MLEKFYDFDMVAKKNPGDETEMSLFKCNLLLGEETKLSDIGEFETKIQRLIKKAAVKSKDGFSVNIIFSVGVYDRKSCGEQTQKSFDAWTANEDDVTIVNGSHSIYFKPDTRYTCEEHYLLINSNDPLS